MEHSEVMGFHSIVNACFAFFGFAFWRSSVSSVRTLSSFSHSFLWLVSCSVAGYGSLHAQSIGLSCLFDLVCLLALWVVFLFWELSLHLSLHAYAALRFCFSFSLMLGSTLLLLLIDLGPFLLVLQCNKICLT